MVEIYTKIGCPYCVRALMLLKKKKVKYKEIKIDTNASLRQEMIERTSGYTVPQIIINGQAIGGCDDLYALENEAKLDSLLAKEN
ncbi:glutaredoxin 3 [Thiotrichales bacterium 19S11-10]|nr:glutaredoxin 3 [Thiotrichales bacterium 19S11-10]